MKIIKVPNNLFFITSILILTIPISTIEQILLHNAEWRNLPYEKMVFNALISGVIFIPIATLICHGYKIALNLALFIGVIWCIKNTWLSFSTGLFWYLIFNVFFISYWIFTYFIIRKELKKSFLDPKMHWYQGLPKHIPSLKSSVEKNEFRVARIDRDGAFIFNKNKKSNINLHPEMKKHTISFKYRGNQISCKCEVISTLKRGVGYGVRFSDLSWKENKQLGDFIEKLYGEGYS